MSPGEVEPNLGYPGEKSIPLSNQYYQLMSPFLMVIPTIDIGRYNLGLQPGGISVFDEGTLTGIANSII